MKIDKLIAEKVMGWKLIERSLRDSEGHYDALCWDKGNMEESYFRPSTKLEHAWKVVECLRENEVYLQIYTNGMEGYEVVYLDDLEIASFKSDSISMAICLAALKSVGIDGLS